MFNIPYEEFMFDYWCLKIFQSYKKGNSILGYLSLWTFYL